MAGRSKSNDKGHTQREYAVIGLGGFGGSLARRLEAMGHMVLGVDSNTARVQDIADEITSAVALDATIEDALVEVDITAFDTVVVALGHAFEASALVTSYLKEAGIRRVICTAETRRHQKILLRIGADQVIVPDVNSGLRLAETLAAPNFLERVLFDSIHSVIELKTPASLVAQPAAALERYGAKVLLIYRQGQLLPAPSAETALREGDTLLAAGEREKLLELASLQ